MERIAGSSPEAAPHLLVSVIIPVRDDTGRLLLCLDALDRQTVPRRSFEVIVVDNASAEAVAKRVGERPGTIVLREPKIGSYAARNRGASEARGEILAFTDADCVPDVTWLQEGIAALEASPESLVAGRISVFIRDVEDPTAVELYEKLFAFPQKRFAEIMNFGATANIFVPRRLFREAEGFCDALQSGGDNEFGTRLAAGGVPVIYSHEAVVHHPARRDWASLRRKIRRVEAGRAQLRMLRGESSAGIVADPAYAWNRLLRIWKADLSLIQKLGVQFVFLRAKVAALAVERGWGS